tara:strand:+ start:2407 stop:2691 length:285 start_codon:yes stop_codon:yes gene_type:complete
MKEKVIKIILDTINDFNEDLEPNDKMSTNLDDVIYGDGSSLDSLGLVSFIVGLEEELEDAFGKSISLADEKAMSQKSNPYKSIDSLSEFILKLL